MLNAASKSWVQKVQKEVEKVKEVQPLLLLLLLSPLPLAEKPNPPSPRHGLSSASRVPASPSHLITGQFVQPKPGIAPWPRWKEQRGCLHQKQQIHNVTTWKGKFCFGFGFLSCWSGAQPLRSMCSQLFCLFVCFLRCSLTLFSWKYWRASRHHGEVFSSYYCTRLLDAH